jgi:predicted transcriptional regulator
MKNRSKTDIIAVILKVANSNGGAIQARIMYEANLS